MRRSALLWLALFAVYAATLGLHASGDAPLAPGEARVLLGAESIVSDGDVDLRDEYRSRAYDGWVQTGRLEPVAGLTEGRLHEPPGVGTALVLAGPYAIAGRIGAELFVAALLAMGFVAAAAIGRRLVPDPWATGAALIGGLSPPAVGWSTAIAPEPIAAAAVAVATVFALRVRHAPAPRRAVTAALMIGALPWLNVKFLPAAVVLAAVLARWLRRRRRGLSAFVALEIVLVSAVALVSVSERLYGGLSPYAAVTDATGASGAAEYAERIPRLATAFLDPDVGLLVWAPFGVLAFVSIVLLVRALRDRLAVAIPGVVDVEVSAGLLVVLCAVQIGVAVLLTPSLEEPAFPARELIPVLPVGTALAAWALRRLPRAGLVLATVTIGASAWLLIGGRFSGASLAPPEGPIPWSGAEPVVAVLVGLGLAGLLLAELRRGRDLA